MAADVVWVPRAGFEPARPLGPRILSPQRLPFRHLGPPDEEEEEEWGIELVGNAGLEPATSRM